MTTHRFASLAFVLGSAATATAQRPALTGTWTDVTATSVTFENPSHDYPKVIRYAQTPDGGLETTIAGAGGARPQRVILAKVQPSP